MEGPTEVLLRILHAVAAHKGSGFRIHESQSRGLQILPRTRALLSQEHGAQFQTAGNFFRRASPLSSDRARTHGRHARRGKHTQRSGKNKQGAWRMNDSERLTLVISALIRLGEAFLSLLPAEVRADLKALKEDQRKREQSAKQNRLTLKAVVEAAKNETKKGNEKKTTLPDR